MKTEKTFFNAEMCEKASKKLIEIANIFGGIEDNDSLNAEIVVSKDDCINASEQFLFYSKSNGEYFSNIIKYPHFTSKEIKSILYTI